ncbi:MAG: phage tail tape measure protein [Butyrivibrio sp.]|nr:phage tail tape measure protein [Butyrivibrio sp.]
MPKEELVVAPENQVQPPVNNVVQGEGLNAIADKKEEKPNRVSDRNKNPVINGIRERLKENLMETNRKSRSKRHRVADDHRAKSREIVSVLDTRKQLVRKQKLLDYEQQMITGTAVSRQVLEADMRDYLENVRAGLQAAADAKADEANAAYMKARATEAAAKERKSQEETDRLIQLSKMAKLTAERASAKKAKADDQVKKLDEEAKAKKEKGENEVEKNEQEGEKLELEKKNDEEALKNEQEVEKKEEENPEKKEEIPVVEKEENPELNEGEKPPVNPEKKEEEVPEKKEEVPVKKEEEIPKNEEQPPVKKEEIPVYEVGNVQSFQLNGKLEGAAKGALGGKPEKLEVPVYEVGNVQSYSIGSKKAEGAAKGALEPNPQQKVEDLEDDGDILLEDAGNLKDLEAEAARVQPHEALVVLANDISKIKTYMPSSADLKKDVSDYVAILQNLDAGNKPFFTSFAGWNNRRKADNIEADLDKNEEQIKKIMTAWKSRRDYHKDVDVKPLDRTYDSIARSWYELTHQYTVSQLPEDATEAEIMSSLENRSIPVEAAKSIEEYTGYFDETEMDNLLGKIEDNPYLELDQEDIPKKSLAPADTSPSESELSVVHTDITMYSKADEFGNQRKFVFDRTFMGREVESDRKSQKRKWRKRGYGRKKVDSNIILHAEQANLVSDMLDENGEFMYSESNRGMVHNLKKTFGVSQRAMYEPDKEPEKEPEQEADMMEKISSAIRTSVFFKHINSETILRYAAYNEGPVKEGEEVSEFALAPGLSEFAGWAVTQTLSEPETFNQAIGKLLGDESFSSAPEFNEALKKETGISGLSELQKLVKIFMIIDSHNLLNNAKTPEQEKLVEVVINGVFNKADPEIIKSAKLSELLKYVGLSAESDWRAILNQAVANS